MDGEKGVILVGVYSYLGRDAYAILHAISQHRSKEEKRVGPSESKTKETAKERQKRSKSNAVAY